MREYILNIKFGTWQNQLQFMNSDNSETEEKWLKATQEIDKLKSSYNEAIEYQTGVINYLENLGFERVQKQSSFHKKAGQ